MREIIEHIRAHAMLQAGCCSLGTLQITEWDYEFEQLMRNRLIMGALRYSPLKAGERKEGHTAMIIGYILDKLEEYDQTGNLEMLVDLANLAMVEYLHSDHPKKHFKSIDREE